MSSSKDKYSLKHMSHCVGSSRQTADSDGERSLIAPPSGEIGTSDDVTDQQQHTTGFVYVLAFFSAIGGLLFGYDTGVVSGAMLLLKKEMNLNALWQELLVSSTVGAAAVSALSGGYLNDWLGRRICILMSSFIFTVGGIIMGSAPDKVVLLVGRVTVGLGIGECFQGGTGLVPKHLELMAQTTNPIYCSYSRNLIVLFCSFLFPTNFALFPFY